MTDFSSDLNYVINESLTNESHWVNVNNVSNNYPKYIKYDQSKLPLSNDLKLLSNVSNNPLTCKFADSNGSEVIYKLVTNPKSSNYYLRQLVKKLTNKVMELEKKIEDIEKYSATDETTI